MPPLSDATLYARLGLERFASANEIRRSYHQAALRWHPDRCPGDPAAAERFKACLQAYEILSNPTKRALYDQQGLAAVLPTEWETQQQQQQHREEYWRHQEEYRWHQEEYRRRYQEAAWRWQKEVEERQRLCFINQERQRRLRQQWDIPAPWANSRQTLSSPSVGRSPPRGREYNTADLLARLHTKWGLDTAPTAPTTTTPLPSSFHFASFL